MQALTVGFTTAASNAINSELSVVYRMSSSNAKEVCYVHSMAK